MIHVTRRRVLVAILALFLVGVGHVGWTLAGLPPVKYYIRYGLDPYCGPTGETFEVEGVTFVEIGPGVFFMGSDHLAEGGDWLGKICAPFGLPWGKQPEASDEMPVHWVDFHRGFWIAMTEITNGHYERFEKHHERSKYSKGDNDPVVWVSWDEAKIYCAWLAVKAERPIRLPSEAEWECACRAGGDGEFTFGDDEAQLSEYAWFWQVRESCAPAVATKRPNAWGLHDLHGSVWEWCEDKWHDSYVNAPVDGSARMEDGLRHRVGRGGSFVSPAVYARSAKRWRLDPLASYWNLGFRPAMSRSGD